MDGMTEGPTYLKQYSPKTPCCVCVCVGGGGERYKTLRIYTYKSISAANTNLQMRLRLFTGRYAPFYSHICIKHVLSLHDTIKDETKTIIIEKNNRKNTHDRPI